MLLIFVDVDELKESHTNYTRHKKASYTYQFPPIHPNNYHIYLKEKQNNPLRCADDVPANPAPTGRARETETPTTQTDSKSLDPDRAIHPASHQKMGRCQLVKWCIFPDFSSSEGALQSPQYGLNKWFVW